MDLEFKGRRALIVGGSRGIGLAIARGFVEEGAEVAITGRRPEVVKEAEAQLSLHGNAIGVSGDAANQEHQTNLLAEVDRAWGGLDILVLTVSARMNKGSDEAWLSTFQTDLMSTIRLIRLFLPKLEKSKQGAIVLIGSTAGSEIAPAFVKELGGESPYGAAKAALVNYIKNMAFDLAPKGVRANIVSPGNIFEEGGAWGRLKQAKPELYQKMLAENPSGRMGTTREVRDCVLFLASPRASFVTGQNLVVDGGLTRRVG